MALRHFAELLKLNPSSSSTWTAKPTRPHRRPGQRSARIAAALAISVLGGTAAWPLLAEFYAVLSDNTKALDWLERAVRAGNERADWFQRDARLRNVRDEPRFQQILDSIRYRRRQRAR
jgi:hypothetical protein